MKKYLVISLVLSVMFAADVSTKEVYSDNGLKLLIQREIPKPVIVEKEVIKEVVNTEREEALQKKLASVIQERNEVFSNYDLLKQHTDEAKRIVDAKTSGRQWWDNPFYGFLAGLVLGNLLK